MFQIMQEQRTLSATPLPQAMNVECNVLKGLLIQFTHYCLWNNIFCKSFFVQPCITKCKGGGGEEQTSLVQWIFASCELRNRRGTMRKQVSLPLCSPPHSSAFKFKMLPFLSVCVAFQFRSEMKCGSSSSTRLISGVCPPVCILHKPPLTELFENMIFLF